MARGTDEPAVYDEPNIIKYAIRFDAWPSKDGLARIDLDYAAIWELPPTSQEKNP